MIEYYLKREVKQISRSRILLFGPLNSDGSVPKGQIPQKLKFNLNGGVVARCFLIPGKKYDAYIEMYGDLTGSLTATVQPSNRSAPFKKIFKSSIPSDWPYDRGHLGHSFFDMMRFTIKET